MICEAYVDYDDVLSSVLREEKQGGHSSIQVCREGDTLIEILTDYIYNNM